MKIRYLYILAGIVISQGVSAKCNDLSPGSLAAAINVAASANTGGYGLNMWVTFVDETGKVCQITTNGAPGPNAGNSAWLGSRIISAQKANTANDFSLDGYAISTANLYSAVQPGGSLFGLQDSNPVDAAVAYQGGMLPAYGTALDPIVGKRLGGINVFGGGLALYKGGKKIGAIGVSGDTSCRDHAFAWRIRGALVMHPSTGITNFNMNANGVSQAPIGIYGDEMIIKSGPTDSYWSAWSQPACPNSLSLGSQANAANGTILLQ